ncbi:hypothetical protein [Candidatus Nanohalococcus occultus]|uniref:hypothetical protein n=1 Tax=Candidatus Nanohalococcus occultus TaxID=2978047 RepID=UPI0039DFD86E
MGFEGETVVISNGQEVYIWRPERSQSNYRATERAKSFIEPVSQENSFRLTVDEYASRQENRIWVDPRGLSQKVEEGCIARLKNKIPAILHSSCGSIETVLEFKYRLTRPGTVNAIVCSKNYCENRKSLVDETVKVDYIGELIEKQVDAKKNPLKP